MPRKTPYNLHTPHIRWIPYCYGGDWLPHLIVCRHIDDFAGPHATVLVFVTWSPWRGLKKWVIR